jgi:hypothetical protein
MGYTHSRDGELANRVRKDTTVGSLCAPGDGADARLAQVVFTVTRRSDNY